MSEETQTPTPEVAPENTEPQLSVQHIALVTQIIDLSSERGAFKGPELTTVGQVRDAFAAFVEFHAPKQEEKPTDAPSAEATEETSE